MTIREIIVETAKSYDGTREIPNNAGWYNAVFQKKMIEMGWKKSWHWCAIFAKLVYNEAYNKLYNNPLVPISKPPLVKQYLKSFSPNSQRTYRNFKANGFSVISFKDVAAGVRPKAGDIMIFHYSGITGHTGIVVESNQDYFKTVEGNASNIVKECVHYYAKTPQLLGFISVYE